MDRRLFVSRTQTRPGEESSRPGLWRWSLVFVNPIAKVHAGPFRLLCFTTNRGYSCDTLVGKDEHARDDPARAGAVKLGR